MRNRLRPWCETTSGIFCSVTGPFCFLVRPREAIRFLAALGITGAVLSLPANALVSPTSPVGATPGTFAVSPSGAATYTIPIVVPPGVNGIQPNLALVYNSQGGNGFLGIGWSLSGLSVIHRCGATIELDGFKGGVNYDANDKFCLDGERLMPVGGTQYRTEKETLQKIQASDGTHNPAWFTVTSSDGTVREYAVPIEAAGNPSIRRLWAVSKVKDKFGNYYTIAYDKSSVQTDGDYRPVSIAYTANDTAGAPLYNSVALVYGSRTDVVPYYEGGSVIRTPRLLTSVASYAGTTKVREYQLGYDGNGAMGQSRLVSVRECGTDNFCMPGTTIQWRAGAGSFEPVSTHPEFLPNEWFESAYPGRVMTMDVNGDGKSDLVAMGSGVTYVALGNGYGFEPKIQSGETLWNEWFETQYPGRVHVMDVNGDGRQDVVATGSGVTYVALSNGTGFNLSAHPEFVYNEWFSSNYPGRVMAMDVNGDGRSDLVAMGSGVTYVALSNGSGFDPKIQTGEVLPNDWFETAYPNRVHIIDINGDGRQDVVATGSGVTYIATSNGAGFNLTAHPEFLPNEWFESAYPGRVMTMDVNGDGKSDLVAMGSGVTYVALGNGYGFEPKIQSGETLWNEWFETQYPGRVHVMDVNGDGRQDVVATGSGVTYVALSNGTGFNLSAHPEFVYNEWFSSNFNGRVRTADVNGDGKTDLVATGSGVTYVLRAAGVSPDLVTSVTNGLGATANFAYKPLTDNSVYIKDTNLNYVWGYPYQEVQAPIYVVSQTTATNGAGGLNATGYKYVGLKQHHWASESLGFRRTEMTDPANLTHITEYTQRRELGTDGNISLSETYAPDGVRLKYLANTWTFVASVCGGRPQAQLTSARDQTRELNGTVVTDVTTTNTYDGCGYPTQSVVDMGGGHRKTTANQYSHDTTNWRLGMVTQTDVISDAPGQIQETRTATFAYDTLGRLTTETIAPNSAALTVTTRYDNYDAFGHWLTRTVSGPDIEPRSDNRTFDTRGLFVASKTNALGHITSFAYDERNGQPTRITDPNLLVTTMDYDGFGRKGIETRPDGVTTRITYSATASGYSIQTHTDGAGDVYTFYDILGRPVRTSTQAFGGSWIYQDTTYDALGRVTQKTHPYFQGEATHVTTFGYDILSRGTSITEAGPGNRTTTTNYNGLTTTVINPSYQSKTMVKDVQGRTISVTDNVGTVFYQYDAVGNLTQVTGVGGNITAMQYDNRDRKIAMQDPDMGSWIYAYNVLSELKSQRDAKIKTTSMTYDKLGRMLTKTTPEAVSTWTYDAAALGSTGRLALGKLATVVKSTDNYSESYTYNNLGLTKTSTVHTGSAHVVTYDYDAYSRVEYITYPNTGFKVRQRYDAFGYLYQVNRARPNGTETLLWQTTGADAHARVVQEMFGNGLYSNRSYNHETGDLETIKTGTAANPTGIQNLSYTFDAIDNLLTRADVLQGLTETFEYDAVNRLTRATAQGSATVTKTYAYSANGNITSKSDVGTYTYGSTRPHAVTQIQGIVNTTYTYDANGNQLTGGGRTITYTIFNKPKTIVGSNGTTRFFYDVNNNRFKKTTATSTTIYVGKLYERVVTGSLTEHKHYIYGGKNLVATYTQRNNGTKEFRYIHTDHLDSINVLTDDNGIAVERLSFDPHGKRRNQNGSDATGPITSSINRGYTRHEHDDEVGLINMNARLYDPITGRFIAPDTIIPGAGNSQAYNRYAYVENNPLSLVDPTGHASLRKIVRNAARAYTRYQITNAVAGAYIAAGFYIGGPRGAVQGARMAYYANKAYRAGARTHEIFHSSAKEFAAMYASTYADKWVDTKGFELDNWKAAATYGVIKGAAQQLQGGRFKDGFIGGFVGQYGRLSLLDSEINLGSIEFEPTKGLSVSIDLKGYFAEAWLGAAEAKAANNNVLLGAAGGVLGAVMQDIKNLGIGFGDAKSLLESSGTADVALPEGVKIDIGVYHDRFTIISLFARGPSGEYAKLAVALSDHFPKRVVGGAGDLTLSNIWKDRHIFVN